MESGLYRWPMRGSDAAEQLHVTLSGNARQQLYQRSFVQRRRELTCAIAGVESVLREHAGLGVLRGKWEGVCKREEDLKIPSRGRFEVSRNIMYVSVVPLYKWSDFYGY